MDIDNKESRTTKSIRNILFSFGYTASDIVVAFALRTIFIYTLGMSYLGLNSLFANILTVLSMMELGIGGAIVFSLYEPLALKNYEKVSALMQLYKKTYRTIGILVLFAGFSLTPFLQYIVNLPTKVDNINLIYWISVINVSLTYFLSYRRSLLMADQRSDINTKNQIFFRIIRFLLLSSVLYCSHNYILYLFSDAFITVLSNVQITMLVKKKYKNIELIKPTKLLIDDKKGIVKFVKSGLLFKIGQTVVNSTDSIIISCFVSTVSVGIYSNYCLITNNIENFVSQIFSGVTASIGNYAITKNNKEIEILFRRVFFANYAISYFLSTCTYSLITPFVYLWAGSNYVMDYCSVSIMILNFYIALLQKGAESFLAAKGEMFYHNRFRSLCEAIVNLIISIFLANTSIGIIGVLLGTTFCFLCGRSWMDVYTLYKKWFDMPFKCYLKTYLFRLMITIFVSLCLKLISNCIFNIFGLSFLSWIVSGFIISLISILIFIIIYYKCDDYNYYICLLKNRVIDKFC